MKVWQVVVVVKILELDFKEKNMQQKKKAFKSELRIKQNKYRSNIMIKTGNNCIFIVGDCL